MTKSPFLPMNVCILNLFVGAWFCSETDLVLYSSFYTDLGFLFGVACLYLNLVGKVFDGMPLSALSCIQFLSKLMSKSMGKFDAHLAC